MVVVRLIFITLITLLIIFSILHLWKIEHEATHNKSSFCMQLALKYVESNIAYDKKFIASNTVANKKETLAGILDATNCMEILHNNKQKDDAFYTDSQFYNILYLSVAMTSGLFTGLYFLLNSLVKNRDNHDDQHNKRSTTESVRSNKNDDEFLKQKQQEHGK